jgi:hypothetical protein
MAILDTQLRFSSNQTVSGTNATVASTDHYDTGAVPSVGEGEPLSLQVDVGTTAFSGGTSVQVALQTAADASFSSGLVTIPLTPAIPVASATARANLFKGRLPYGLKRYIRVAYITVGAVSAGSANAFIAKDIEAGVPAPTTVPSVKV